KPSYLRFVDIIARKIENNMLLERPEKQIVISLQNDALSQHEALIAVTEDGKITGMNRAARETLPLNQHGNVTIQLNELFVDADLLLDQFSSSNLSFNIVNIRSNNYEESFIASILKNNYPTKVHMSNVKPNDDIARKEDALIIRNENINPDFPHIIGQDKAFTQALETAKKVAPTKYNVSITGESGTGKDLVSYAIHQA